MTLDEFKTLPDPSNLSPVLQALWYDARGDWERAHALAQEAANSSGDWVHAYLHRKEGDEGNARYWYTRARKIFPTNSLSAEWEHLASAFLSNHPN